MRVIETRCLLRGIVMSGLLLGAGCSQAPQDVKIVREEILSNVQAEEIARAPDGDFVIAGSEKWEKPWAMRVDAIGRVRWQYVFPVAIQGRLARGFSGVAVLPDGSSILCAMATRNQPRRIGWIVHLSASGTELSRMTIEPKNLQPGDFFTLDRCLRWGNGVAVLGSVNRYRTNGWLAKLDASGNVQWEKWGPLGAYDAYETSDDELVLAVRFSDATRLQRVGPTGDVLAEGQVSGQAKLVRPLMPADSVRVLSMQSDGPNSLWTLDMNLHPVGNPLMLKNVYIKVAYQLADRSVIVLGTARQGWSDADITAAIFRIYASGSARTLVLQPPHLSGEINDAVPANDPDTFATVRELGPERSALTWVTVSVTE